MKQTRITNLRQLTLVQRDDQKTSRSQRERKRMVISLSPHVCLSLSIQILVRAEKRERESSCACASDLARRPTQPKRCRKGLLSDREKETEREREELATTRTECSPAYNSDQRSSTHTADTVKVAAKWLGWKERDNCPSSSSLRSSHNCVWYVPLIVDVLVVVGIAVSWSIDANSSIPRHTHNIVWIDRTIEKKASFPFLCSCLVSLF